MSEVFRVAADGVHMELVPWQIELLASIAPMVEAGTDRLPHEYYRDAPTDNDEVVRLMERETAAAEAADLEVVRSTLEQAVDGVLLDLPTAEAWVRAVGKARLILADRVGVTNAGWEADDSLTETPELALLHYLSWIQSSLVDALTDLLPEPAA